MSTTTTLAEAGLADPPSAELTVTVFDLIPAVLPRTECLKDTVARVVPVWNEAIAPAIKLGKQVIVAAHGNSLRALVKMLDGMSESQIVEFNIPTGIPILYDLDDSLASRGRRFLGDAAAIAAAQDAVRRQTEKK